MSFTSEESVSQWKKQRNYWLSGGLAVVTIGGCVIGPLLELLYNGPYFLRVPLPLLLYSVELIVAPMLLGKESKEKFGFLGLGLSMTPVISWLSLFILVSLLYTTSSGCGCGGPGFDGIAVWGTGVKLLCLGCLAILIYLCIPKLRPVGFGMLVCLGPLLLVSISLLGMWWMLILLG